jgi:hypothetical protein
MCFWSSAGTAADAGAASERSSARPLLVLPKSYRDNADRAPRYTLKPAKDGSNDLIAETPSFVARIAPDGGVRFEDSPRKLSLRPPWLPMPVRPGTVTLESYLSTKLKRNLPKPEWRANEPETREQGSVIPQRSPDRPDPGEECRQHPQPCHLGLQPMLLNTTGKFDLTDALGRVHGEDPYRDEKARFLAETRELRIQMAVRSHLENVRTEQANLPKSLRAIACDDSRPKGERKAIIEALQSEMDTGLAEGKRAAGQVRAFLRDWLEPPDGGAVCP